MDLDRENSSRRRRRLVPLMVVFIGGSLAFWGVRRESLRSGVVETQVKAIARDLADGRDLVGRLNPDNSTVDAMAIDALRQVVDSPATADVLSVRVVSGDVPNAGVASARATHTATLMIGDAELLLLRVRCEDLDKPITILGVVAP